MSSLPLESQWEPVQARLPSGQYMQALRRAARTRTAGRPGRPSHRLRLRVLSEKSRPWPWRRNTPLWATRPPMYRTSWRAEARVSRPAPDRSVTTAETYRFSLLSWTATPTQMTPWWRAFARTVLHTVPNVDGEAAPAL